MSSPSPPARRLTINGIDVSGLLDGAVCGRNVNLTAMMEAALRKDGLRLRELDLRGEVSLEASVDGQFTRLFTGYVVRSGEGDGGYRLSCTDATCILEEERTGGALGRGLLPGEIIYYLLAETMPESTDKSLLYADRERRLDEVDWIFRPRRYVCVVPLPSCALEGGEVEFAECTLYTAGNPGSADDQNIALSLPNDAPAEWLEGRTRARFYVEAEGFLDAFEKARERLRRLVDYVSFGANLATPAYPNDGGYAFHTFERERLSVEVAESDWVYLRDTYPGATRYWLKWFAPHRARRALQVRQDDPLVALYPTFRQLLEEEDSRLTRRQRALLSALHALRRGRQAPYTLDALHHVWQSVEFLVGGAALPQLFPRETVRTLTRGARLLLRRLHRPTNLEEEEALQERVRRIESIVGGLNDLPLRGKWRLFCNNHKLALAETDEKFLWTIRRVRNDDVHGKFAIVRRQDVERAAGIVEKAILVAVEAEYPK